MKDYQLTKLEEKTLWQEGWIAHMNGQSMICITINITFKSDIDD